MKKQRAPALPDSNTFQQLWDALGSRLFESAREHLLYTPKDSLTNKYQNDGMCR